LVYIKNSTTGMGVYLVLNYIQKAIIHYFNKGQLFSAGSHSLITASS